ncbi:MAG: hypothetical protein ABIH24_02460 [Verrucomicrobiota bacterium]
MRNIWKRSVVTSRPVIRTVLSGSCGKFCNAPKHRLYDKILTTDAHGLTLMNTDKENISVDKYKGKAFLKWKKKFTVSSLHDYEKNDYNALTEGYAPKNCAIADFGLIFAKDRRYHLFHIVRRGGTCLWPGNECYFGHAATENFVNWITYDPVLYVREHTWESHHVFAPFPFYFKGKYHLAYTGITRTMFEGIGLAHSDDLFHWERDHGNPIISPDRCKWMDSGACAACRDPHVLIEKDICYLYFSCITKFGYPAIGCATSEDLAHWSAPVIVYTKEPVCAPGGLVESSAVHARPEGGYILFFNHVADGNNQRLLGDNAIDFKKSRRKTLPMDGMTIEVVAKLRDKWLIATFFQGKLFLYIFYWKDNDIDISRTEKVKKEIQIREFMPEKNKGKKR